MGGLGFLLSIVTLYNVCNNCRYSLVDNFKDNFEDKLVEVWWTISGTIMWKTLPVSRRMCHMTHYSTEEFKGCGDHLCN